MSRLSYTNAVISETLRHAVITPWAARFSYEIATVGSYSVPPCTPIIHALGVVLQDEYIWPNVREFDPERFLRADVIAARPPLAFSPFGFAGRRSCPAQRYAQVQACIILSAIVKTLALRPAKGQEAPVPVHGLVTVPSQEFYLEVKERSRE